jgi:hypothetical protein
VTTEQLEGREWTYIIDLSTNEIVFREYGVSGLEEGLAELSNL